MSFKILAMHNFWLALFIVFHKTCWSNTHEDVSTRMVNGTKVSLGEFPFVVVISDKKGFPFCSGSLISPGHVLSAAHCFLHNMAGMFFVAAGDIVVARKRQYHDPPAKQILRVAKVRVHYNAKGVAQPFVPYDLAVLTLNGTFSLSANVALITVAEANMEVGSSCMGLGFGYSRRASNETSLQRFLRSGKFVIEANCCSEMECYCVRDQWVSVYRGDSGGPLTNAKPPYFVYGVCSVYDDTGRGKYVNVVRFRSWIAKQVDSDASHFKAVKSDRVDSVRSGLPKFMGTSAIILVCCQVIIQSYYKGSFVE